MRTGVKYDAEWNPVGLRETLSLREVMEFTGLSKQAVQARRMQGIFVAGYAAYNMYDANSVREYMAKELAVAKIKAEKLASLLESFDQQAQESRKQYLESPEHLADDKNPHSERDPHCSICRRALTTASNNE